MNNYERYLKRLLDEMENNVRSPEIIYHYTKFENLDKILSSQCLWSTISNCLNDIEELEYCYKNFIKLLEQDKSQNWFNEIITNKNEINQFRAFIISFCNIEDYLPAWKFYANNGIGFSIGFSNELIKPSTSPLPQDQAKRFSAGVIYNKNEMLEWLKRGINGGRNINIKVRTKQEALLEYIVTIASCFKRSEFEFEKEWRLVTADLEIEGQLSNNKDKLKSWSINHNIVDKNTGDYLNEEKLQDQIKYLDDFKFEKDMIKKITIGYSLDNEKTKKYVSALLLKYEYDIGNIEIVFSNSSAR